MDVPSARARLKARLRRMLRPPRRAIPTVPGLFALAAPTFLGLAAVTATNNLLFLLLGATLGAIVLSGILSERNIKTIRVGVRPVAPVYAAEVARLQVRFHRKVARSSAFDLRFREAPGPLLRWPWTKRPGAPEVLDVTVPVLDGAETAVLGARRFEARGRAGLALCEISTRYPFGLLIKSKDVEPELEVWVRPRRVPRPPELARPPGVSGMGETAARRGQGLDLFGLRERTERDPLHRVHALRSLALGRQVVLEMSGVERPVASIGVVSTLEAEPEAFERALELAQAALLAWHEEGFAVGLTTASEHFEPGASELEVLLDHLAALEPVGAFSPPRSGPRTWLVPRGARAPAQSFAVSVGPAGLEATRAAA